MDPESGSSSFMVASKDGHVVDLGPLVDCAKAVNRNALQDAEFERELGASPITVAAFQMGMRVAVEKLFGDEVAEVFDAGCRPEK